MLPSGAEERKRIMFIDVVDGHDLGDNAANTARPDHIARNVSRVGAKAAERLRPKWCS
jgi:hypothetical protein